MSDNRPAVAIDTGVALLRTHLAGYRGYPHEDAGERRFARALSEVCVSVEHAVAVLEKFEESFPTVRELKDVALNLRDQFQPKLQTYQDWEKEYGKPQQFSIEVPDKSALHWQAVRDAIYYTEGPGRVKCDSYWREAMDRDLRHWPSLVFDVRAEADTYGWDDMMARQAPHEGIQAKPKDHEMWRQLRIHFTAKRGGWPGWAKISWRDLFAAMPELGYPLNHAQQLFLGS
jgi:hypothetical protein